MNYALLMGMGGSGKQSLSRLAAYISSLDVFQVTLRKGYGIQDLRLQVITAKTEDLKQSHSELVVGAWLPGEIPELFSDEEADGIITGMRNEVRGLGLLDSRENCCKFFIDRSQQQLKPSVQESISLFMAYIHTSVNETSEKYRQNEKRYNYTTPKNFLEKITL
ncbi:UNVERIFIED_CONTAM: hypothetical protein FKN15_017166 [Acipenser sinensis]